MKNNLLLILLFAFVFHLLLLVGVVFAFLYLPEPFGVLALGALIVAWLVQIFMVIARFKKYNRMD